MRRWFKTERAGDLICWADGKGWYCVRDTGAWQHRQPVATSVEEEATRGHYELSEVDAKRYLKNHGFTMPPPLDTSKPIEEHRRWFLNEAGSSNGHRLILWNGKKGWICHVGNWPPKWKKRACIKGPDVEAPYSDAKEISEAAAFELFRKLEFPLPPPSATHVGRGSIATLDIIDTSDTIGIIDTSDTIDTAKETNMADLEGATELRAAVQASGTALINARRNVDGQTSALRYQSELIGNKINNAREAMPPIIRITTTATESV